MATRSIPRPTQLLALLALLAPLLAACGGTAPAAGPIALQPTNAPAAAAPTFMAAEPTAAPALADSKAGPAVGEAAAAEPTRAPESSGVAAQPTPAPRASQQQYTPLRAGEIDDNRDFAAYLEYLQRNGGIRARQVDVSERYILTVVNENQQPVLDALVRIYDQQQLLFEGRTYAGGTTAFFPGRIAMPANNPPLRIEVAKGNSRAESQLARGQNAEQTITLQGAQALPARPRLDVLFLLDATGSMGDEIGQIQQTIVSIAERIDAMQPRPELRLGLVAYRDRGDEYVTRAYDFTGDVATFRDQLLQVRAGGGGDDPESLNEGLHVAIQQMGWADDAVRLTFLVADAPPHLDYAQDYDYVAELMAATARGVKVYTIAASNSGDEAEYILRQIAQQTLAHFIFLTYQAGQNSGAPGDTTVHQVDPQAFTVERLDDLVVQVVQRELDAAQGAR